MSNATTEIERIAPERLIPHPRNSDFFDDLNGPVWDTFLEDVRLYGVLTPLLVTTDNMIIAGHQRHRAAIVVGLHEVPVQRKVFKTEDEKLERLISDNLLSRYGAQNIAKLGTCIKELERIWNVRGQSDPDGHSISRTESVKRLVELTGLSAAKLNTAKNVAGLDPVLSDAVGHGTLSPRVADRLFHALSPLEQRVAAMALECGVFEALTYEEISEIVPSIRQYALQLEEENKGRDAKIEELRTVIDELQPGAMIAETEYDRMRRERDDAVKTSRKYFEEADSLKRAQKADMDRLRKMNKQIGMSTAAISVADINISQLIKLDLDTVVLRELKKEMVPLVKTVKTFLNKYERVIDL